MTIPEIQDEIRVPELVVLVTEPIAAWREDYELTEKVKDILERAGRIIEVTPYIVAKRAGNKWCETLNLHHITTEFLNEVGVVGDVEDATVIILQRIF